MYAAKEKKKIDEFFFGKKGLVFVMIVCHCINK